MHSHKALRETTMKNTLLACIFSLAALLLTVSNALAIGTLPVHISEVALDGKNVSSHNASDALLAGSTVDVMIRAWASERLEDVRVEGFIAAPSSIPMESRTSFAEVGVMNATTITIPLYVSVPEDLLPGDYTLVLIFSDDEDTTMKEYGIEVTRPEHGITVESISVSPEGALKAGRTLSVRAGVFNYGSASERVRVSARIPGVEETLQSTTLIVPALATRYSDSLYLTIPACTPEGTYELTGVVEYADGLRRDVFSHPFTVSASDDCGSAAPASDGSGEDIVLSLPSEKTVISVPPPQDAYQGGGEAVYSIEISNDGPLPRSYYLDISGIDWAWSSVAPSNLAVIPAGSAVTFSLALRAKDTADVGTHAFTVDVRSSDRLLGQLSLAANVLSDSSQAFEADPGMGGLTANVIKRGPSARVDLKAVGEVATTLFVTLAVIILTVFYFVRVQGKHDSPGDEETESEDAEQADYYGKVCAGKDSEK